MSSNLHYFIEGFGYRWSSAIRWEDLVARQTFTLKCPHTDESEAAFRFHAFVQTDAKDTALRQVDLLILN
jgi:vacuolar protein sorting-associated protein 13A/C